MNALKTATAAGDLDRPALSADAVRALFKRELAPAARIKHAALLLAAFTVGSAVAVLWLTEPDPLPLATHLAFAALTLVALAWAALSAYVLFRRRPLFAHHRVVAGSIATAASTLFLVGSTAVALVRHNVPAALTAALSGLAFLALSITALRRARNSRRLLLRHRDDLLAQVAAHSC